VQLMWLCVAVHTVWLYLFVAVSFVVIFIGTSRYVRPTAVSALYGSHYIVAQLYCNIFLLKYKAPSSEHQGAKESCYVQRRSSCMDGDLTLTVSYDKTCRVVESYRKDIKQ
jgi:hypothetical protein